MIDWTNNLIAELISLVRFAAVLIAVASVAYAYGKTRSLVALLVAALTAGVFLWAINNTDWWEQRVEEESGLRPPAAVAASAHALDGVSSGLPDGPLTLGGGHV